MRAALALLAAGAAGACAVPNVVLDAGPGVAGLAELHAPARAEWVEIPAEDGATLRGVWIPGAPGAPVVLYLMEATVGATERGRFHGAYWDFAGAGYSLLAIDYRGVAASGGERSSDHVRGDARAMWREAVTRAGGDPARVALRAGSLGTLAAATLLQEGARPGAVVLYGPVRSETVVRRFMTTGWAGTPRVPDALAPWLALLFRRPLAVDLAGELARCPAPLLVTCGEYDELLPSEDAARLEQAVRAAGGEFATEPLAHVELCIRHHLLRARERAFLARALPAAVDADARERGLLAAISPAAAARFGPEARAELRALAGRRIDDPPAAVAGLLLAGMWAERASVWLDADRATRGRWLAGRSADAVRAIAAVPAADGSEDPVFLALVQRVHAHKASNLSLTGFGIRGHGEQAEIELTLESSDGSATIRMEISQPAGDLVAALAERDGADRAESRLAELLAAAAAPPGGSPE